jgi:hypothetical protein
MLMQCGRNLKQACIQQSGGQTKKSTVHITQALVPTEVLLDTQADISIMHLMLLKDVKKSQKKIRVRGVGGLQLIVNEEGILEGFFLVYVSEKTNANILKFCRC